MLESIDVLSGFAVLMLILSLATTSIIQMLVVVMQLRGRNLRRGIITLLRQIDPTVEHAAAHAIATAVVKHPLVARIPGQMGSIVEREELIELLLGLAAGTEPRSLEANARDQLRTTMQRLGIADPAGVVRDIHATAMRLEIAKPELSANARRTAAIVSEAGSEFVASVNSWFDATIDRVIEAFTAHVRVVTGVVVILLAVVLQVDAFEVINRLAIDEDLRLALVTQAGVHDRESNTSSGDPSDDSGAEKALGSVSALRGLATSKLITLPWDRTEGDQSAPQVPVESHIPGIVVSAILIGFGAPFWFNALKYLLSLRSPLAAKEEADRVERARSGVETGAVTIRTGDGDESGESLPVG